MGIINDNKRYWERELGGSKQVLTLDQDLFPPQPNVEDSELVKHLKLNFDHLNIDSEDVMSPNSKTAFEKQYFSERTSIFGNGFMDLESLREEEEDDYIEDSRLDKHSLLQSELSIRSNNKSRSNSTVKNPIKKPINNRIGTARGRGRIASAAPKKLPTTNQNTAKRTTPTKQSMTPVMELNSFSFTNSKSNVRSISDYDRKPEQCFPYGKNFSKTPRIKPAKRYDPEDTMIRSDALSFITDADET